MTREIGIPTDPAESHINHIAPGGSDSLQTYRMDQTPIFAGGKIQLSPISGDQLVIPPLHQHGDGAAKPTPATHAHDGPAKPTTAHAHDGPAGHDHVVQHNDNLWKIAEHSLATPGHHVPSPGQIWHQVQNIIQANKHNHPELEKNPNMLHAGMKLHIPGQDHHGNNESHAHASEHHREDHESHSRAGEHHREGHHHGSKSHHGRREHNPEERPQHGNEQSQPRPEQEPRRKGSAAPDDRTPQEADKTPPKEGDHNLLKDVGEGVTHALSDVGEGVTHALSDLGHGLAKIAMDVAHQIETIGNCAKGPRLAFDKVGFRMPQVVATEQGRIVRNSGLFDEVPRNQVRPGDYGVRDWSAQVTREHGGVNKGDAFIVTSVGARGQLYGANDHTFAVPPDGGRYRNLKFYRPNAEFIKRYGNLS